MPVGDEEGVEAGGEIEGTEGTTLMTQATHRARRGNMKKMRVRSQGPHESKKGRGFNREPKIE